MAPFLRRQLLAPVRCLRACGLTVSAVGGVGRIVGVGLDMAKIIDIIQAPNRFVVDQTGLKDRYDIDVTYTYFSPATLPRPNGPSLLTAVKEQLGFNLQYKKMPLPVVVIDHIEPLTEN